MTIETAGKFEVGMRTKTTEIFWFLLMVSSSLIVDAHIRWDGVGEREGGEVSPQKIVFHSGQNIWGSKRKLLLSGEAGQRRMEKG